MIRFEVYLIISLGILSLFQLTIIPGLLISRIWKIRGFWETLLVSIGLSPIFNYCFVLIATTLKFYNRTSVLILFVLESLLLIILFFPTLKKSFNQIYKQYSIRSFFKEYLLKNSERSELKQKIFNALYILCFILATYSLYRYFMMYGTKPTLIFSGWDAVVSWDKWAMEWYQGVFPTQTWHYPQLIPTNLSIPYQFINTTDVKYFSKYFASLLEIFLLFAVFLLGIKKKRVGYFIGTFLTAWLMFAFGSRGSGYADTPVAYWGLLSIIALIIARDNRDENKLLIIGALFSAGAALTKQAGLWMVVLYPVLLIIHKRQRKQRVWPTLLLSMVIFLILISPWYIYKEYQISIGGDISEIQYVTSLVLNGRNPFQIISDAMKLFNATLHNKFFNGNVTFVLLFISFIASFKDAFWRKVNIFLTVPFMFVWIFFFSYENRNVDFIIPLIAISSGIGLEHIFELTTEKIKGFIQRILTFSVVGLIIKFAQKIFHCLCSIKLWIFLFLIPLLFLLPLKVSDDRLIKNSLIKQRNLGEPGLNQKLYDYYYENGFDGKILTQYMYLGFIPELKEYYEHYQTNDLFIPKFEDPSIGYALLNDHWISVEEFDYIKNLINTRKIQLIFEYETVNGKYYFVNSCQGICEE